MMGIRSKKIWFVVGLGALSWLCIYALTPIFEEIGILGHHAKKLSEMFLALVFIQFLGAALGERYGPTIGIGLSAFFGGLISSTATTAAIARKSKTDPSRIHVFEYLVSLIAMLLETFAIVLVGLDASTGRMSFVFLFPIALATYGSVNQMRFAADAPPILSPQRNDLGSNLKLALLLVLLTAISFYSEKLFGNAGLYAITSVASLFEVHAVTITNTNLHNAKIVSDSQLGNLVVISIAASLVSKLLIVATIGSRLFFRRIFLWTAAISASLGLAWLAFKWA